MPAIVTTPPTIIDLVHPARGDRQGANYFGPFVVGANYYAVLASNLPAGPGNRFLCVYKSIDKGVTWTDLDTANRPLVASFAEFDVILVGGVFKIAYVTTVAGNPVRIITFDTASDTFGAVSASGPSAHNVKLVQFASGDILVWFNQLTLSLCAFTIFSGGAWSANTSIADSKNNVAGLVLGANNIAQAFYYDTSAPGFNLFLRTITSGGVIGGEQNVLSSAFLANQIENEIPSGRISIWNGSFKVPYYNATGQAMVFTGTPYTAPVWDAGVLVDTLAWVAAQDQDGFTLVDSNNNLILFWNTEDFNNINLAIDRMYYSIYNGVSWGAPVLFYDAVANPQLQDLVLTPFQQFLHTLSAVRLANGDFAVITAMEENGFCAGFFLAVAAAPAPVTSKAFRLQIYDDGAGEYVFDSAVNSGIGAGNEISPGAGVPPSLFLLPSPLAVVKPGLLTVQMTNVNKPLNNGGLLSQANSITAFVALVFAIPKKCKRL